MIEIIFWVWGLGDVVRHGMNCCNNWRGQDVEGRGDVEIVSAVGEVGAVVPPELLVVAGEAELEGGERV